MPGPLAGLKVIEIASLGPGPFAGMMLADHGAEVIRVERAGSQVAPYDRVLLRSRRFVEADIKTAQGVEAVIALIREADVVIEGFRPGVMERLGLGPDVLLAINPRLVFGRMTGWGQTGPLAADAGHDINYIAVSGVLGALGRAGEKPTPPINLVGDFGGGGLMLAFGVLAAVLHARSSGQGQVVDCAMTEGSSLLMSMMWGFKGAGLWSPERGTNIIDTGAHFYDTYETLDGGYLAVGPVEPQFYARFRQGLGLEGNEAFDAQMSPRAWPALTDRLADIFRTRTRDDWCAVFEGLDACVTPVLSLDEAPHHPHNVAREAFIAVDGVMQPAPAPRYSLTPCARPVMSSDGV